MADWVNKGSCADLSDLAENSLTVTSQAAGNMTSSNRQAMTAPGSQPVDPLPPAREQDDPNLTMTPEIEPGTSGKPQASDTAGSPGYGRPAWTPTTTPDVKRIPAPEPPPVRGSDTSGTTDPGPARGLTSGRAPR